MPEEEKVYTSMYSRNAELYHHGIQGQKWGVRNGPPYPLGSDVSTGSRLRKIGSSKDLGGEEVKKKTKEEQVTLAKLKLLREDRKQKKESKRDTITSKAVRKAKTMSKEDLQEAVNRLELEKKYANLEKDLAELNKKNPTRMQRVRAVVSKVIKDQVSKTANTVVNSITQEINNKISKEIRQLVKNKIDNPKSDTDEDNKNNTSSDSSSNRKASSDSSSNNKASGDNKDSSKIKKAFNEYKEAYKQSWKDGMDWNLDPETKEPKMSRKERENAANIKQNAEYKDAVAESLRQMYDDPNYEQYKETIFRQYAQSLGAADKYRKENQETIDKLDRQFPNYKSKKKKR